MHVIACPRTKQPFSVSWKCVYHTQYPCLAHIHVLIGHQIFQCLAHACDRCKYCVRYMHMHVAQQTGFGPVIPKYCLPHVFGAVSAQGSGSECLNCKFVATFCLGIRPSLTCFTGTCFTVLLWLKNTAPDRLCQWGGTVLIWINQCSGMCLFVVEQTAISMIRPMVASPLSILSSCFWAGHRETRRWYYPPGTTTAWFLLYIRFPMPVEACRIRPTWLTSVISVNLFQLPGHLYILIYLFSWKASRLGSVVPQWNLSSFLFCNKVSLLLKGKARWFLALFV